MRERIYDVTKHAIDEMAEAALKIVGRETLHGTAETLVAAVA